MYSKPMKYIVTSFIVIQVDVDESPDITLQEKIQAMPTFKFYKSGVKVDELVGASAANLEEKILKNK